MIPLKDTVPRIGFSFITWMLILLNALIFIFEISIPKDLYSNRSISSVLSQQGIRIQAGHWSMVFLRVIIRPS